MAKRKGAAAQWTFAEVVRRVTGEVKNDDVSYAWEGVDALCAQSPAKALELATALLTLGLSNEIPAAQRTTRENIVQLGRQGYNPGNLKVFGHIERIGFALFGNRYESRRAEERAPKTRAVLGPATSKWTDEMLWVFLRSFATNAGSIKTRKFIAPLLAEIAPVEPGGPGAMFLNNLRGVKNPKKPAVKKPKTAAPAKRAAPPKATLEALRARPEDPATLAVFADWLAEQGDPAAELLQLELALVTSPRDASLKKARQAWHAAHPPATPALQLERVLGLPRVAAFEFMTGKADERAALSDFLSSPEAQLVDTLRVTCGRVQPFKPVLEALRSAGPLQVQTFELWGDGALDVGDFFTAKTFPRLAALTLGPHKFARAPRLALPTLQSLTVGVTRHNGPLTLALEAAPSLRTVSLSTAFFEKKFLEDLLRGRWALTGLGLFAWKQPELWGRLLTSPLFPRLERLGACNDAPTLPKGKVVMKDPFS